MFCLFSVSFWRMVSISFGMAVPEFFHSLLMLSSVRVKCGDRSVFGIWVRELLSVGYL